MTTPDWPFGELVPGKYAALVVDPPTKFRSRTALQAQNWKSRRDTEKHYETMTIPELLALPVGELAARDAHLFLWTTSPQLENAFRMIHAWGFRYSAVAFTWVKLRRSHNPLQLRILPTAEGDLHVGLGLTTRKNAEFCLLARRGNARRLSKAVREIILSPVRQHSRKPDEVYGRVEAYCAGPYAELFARQRHPGWDSWGKEVGKYEADRHDPKKRPAAPVHAAVG